MICKRFLAEVSLRCETTKMCCFIFCMFSYNESATVRTTTKTETALSFSRPISFVLLCTLTQSRSFRHSAQLHTDTYSQFEVYLNLILLNQRDFAEL